MAYRGYPHFTNLLYAIPLSGRMLPPEIMFAFHSMATPMNYNMVMQTTKGMPVDQAREGFADYAQKANCKYIFFWDEDVACPPQTIPELIYKMEQHPDIAVCGGVYCLKRDPTEPLIFMGNGNGPYWDWKAGEFFECSGIGMGCTVIRVEALKDLKKPWFRTVSDYSKMLDFGIPALESWTEDLWFCQRLADTKKWKVYCDTSIICVHYDLSTGRGFTLPADCKPMKHLHQKGDKKVLDIGSGIRIEGNYNCKEGVATRCDFEYITSDTDYRCDLRKLPFGNDIFDIAFSGALEMFRPDEVVNVLKEWKRVLKNKGELRLVVDNFNSMAMKLATDENSIINDAAPLFYFNGRHLRKNIFTVRTLKAALDNAEFKSVDVVPSDADHIGVRAIK